MKLKYFAFFFIFLFLETGLFAKTKVTVKNTLGGDLDEIGDYDFFTTTSESDINGDTKKENYFSLGDQLQLDLENEYLTGRFRLEALYQNSADSPSDLIIAPSGFLHFTPLPQLGLVFGNNFYKHFAIKSGYLAAADDTTKYARLLTDSLGEDRYFGNDTVAIYSNGFAGGVSSDWNYGNFYAKFAGGGTFYPEENEFEKALDFGVNAGLSGLFDFGFTAHDVSEEDRKFGLFTGLTSIENLILNGAFYYNFTDSDYLPEERVERSGVDEFKKQSTKYALGLSGGYKFEDQGLGIYADVISGLTNEYIGTIKYYDNDGNLVYTETATIVRGGTIVKYKMNSSGVYEAKRTDEFSHEGIPFYSQLRLTYELSSSMEAAFNIKVRTMINAADCSWLTFYPRLKIDLPEKRGKINAGLRLDMNMSRYKGISSVSIPVSYSYKFKHKF